MPQPPSDPIKIRSYEECMDILRDLGDANPVADITLSMNFREYRWLVYLFIGTNFYLGHQPKLNWALDQCLRDAGL